MRLLQHNHFVRGKTKRRSSLLQCEMRTKRIACTRCESALTGRCCFICGSSSPRQLPEMFRSRPGRRTHFLSGLVGAGSHLVVKPAAGWLQVMRHPAETRRHDVLAISGLVGISLGPPYDSCPAGQKSVRAYQCSRPRFPLACTGEDSAASPGCSDRRTSTRSTSRLTLPSRDRSGKPGVVSHAKRQAITVQDETAMALIRESAKRFASAGISWSVAREQGFIQAMGRALRQWLPRLFEATRSP